MSTLTFAQSEDSLFYNYVMDLPRQELSQAEIKGLLQMREEEKLARDVYLKLYDKWHVSIFKNISNSENRHTEAVKMLLDKYKISDPVLNNAVGAFTHPEMAKLYHDLVAKGEKSLKDALIVGATIEDLDIADLHKRMAETDNKDIQCTFEKLTRGSENHMRAFVSQLKANGGSYQARYIPQGELNRILSSGIQHGFRRGRGMHKRRF
ncbi:MAG: DUF2202 domain-containing protein [Calditrichaeota bacterium]|nr:DUF2202 domain-containing protein [Calditrichota bacterium]